MPIAITLPNRAKSDCGQKQTTNNNGLTPKKAVTLNNYKAGGKEYFSNPRAKFTSSLLTIITLYYVFGSTYVQLLYGFSFQKPM